MSRWWVVAGSTYMTSVGGSAVDKIIVNGQYNTVLNDYDLAMMKLKTPLSLGGRIGQSDIHSHSNTHTINDFDLSSDILYIHI